MIGKKKKIIITIELVILIILSTFVATLIGGNIQNNSPVAYISANVTIGKTPLKIDFIGSGSDNDGAVVSYHWDFGDGETSNLQNPTHIYLRNGSYLTTLTVVDNDGNIGRKNIKIYAQENNSPTVITSDQQSPPNYINVDFSWSPEYPDPGQQITFVSNYYDYFGLITSRFWNFGDGYSAWGPIVSHTYDKKGNYMVTLTITVTNLTSGEISNHRESKNINIGASPFPKFTYSSEIASTGENIYFDASESWDTNGRIVKYHWCYIDSSGPNKVIEMGDNKILTYAWNKQGYYIVKLTVTDDDNNTNEITKEIVISILKIQEVTAGIRHVGFKITNRGNFTVYNINWKVIVNRNFLIIIPLWKVFRKEGIIYSLRPGDSISVDIGRYRRGFGFITMTIIIESDNAMKILESRQGYMFSKLVRLRS